MYSTAFDRSREPEVLTSIEIEVTPRRFGFWLIPDRRFCLGREDAGLAHIDLSNDEEQSLLGVALAMAISNHVWTAASPDADVAFTPSGLSRASVHVRLGFNTGRRWFAWQPIASVPANLWAYCDALRELGKQVLEQSGWEDSLRREREVRSEFHVVTW
jgi:hypothetical protein